MGRCLIFGSIKFDISAQIFMGWCEAHRICQWRFRTMGRDTYMFLCCPVSAHWRFVLWSGNDLFGIFIGKYAIPSQCHLFYNEEKIIILLSQSQGSSEPASIEAIISQRLQVPNLFIAADSILHGTAASIRLPVTVLSGPARELLPCLTDDFKHKSLTQSKGW